MSIDDDNTQNTETTEDSIVELLPELKKKAGRPKGAKAHRDIIRSRKLNKIIELTAKNIDGATIAAAVNLPERSVQRTVAKYRKIFTQLGNAEDYRSIKSDILSACELQALKSALQPSKLKKASFSSLAMGFEIFNKANRLERGQSTENSQVSQFVRVSLQNKPE